MTWAGLAFGVPALTTHFSANPVTRDYVVTGKNRGRLHLRLRDGGCRYSVYIKDSDSEWHAEICTQSEIWEKVKAGDLVAAEVRISSLGTLVEKLSPKN